MSYASNNYFKHGSYNVICDICGVKYKADEVRKRWDGLIVCKEDWEPDHPQKYLRVQSDPKQVPFIRSEPEDEFVDVCWAYEICAYADLATADCARADDIRLTYAVALATKNAGAI